MKHEDAKVTLVVGEGDAKKEFTREYQKTVFETASDVISALQVPEKVEDLIGALNYGFDLKVRAKIRQQLEKETAGPDRAIEKAIKSLMDARAAAGKPITRERAEQLYKIMQESE
jgi:hypothetical protein